jgi:hypothetical protein
MRDSAGGEESLAQEVRVKERYPAVSMPSSVTAIEENQATMGAEVMPEMRCSLYAVL